MIINHAYHIDLLRHRGAHQLLRSCAAAHPCPYGDAEALFDIRTGKVIAGRLPRRETRYVVEWLVKNRVDLMRNWDLAVSGQPTFRIEGLSDD